jgi:hypothetical protein
MTSIAYLDLLEQYLMSIFQKEGSNGMLFQQAGEERLRVSTTK